MRSFASRSVCSRVPSIQVSGTSGARKASAAFEVVVLPAKRGMAAVRKETRSSTAAQMTAAISALMVPLRTISAIVTSGMGLLGHYALESYT